MLTDAHRKELQHRLDRLLQGKSDAIRSMRQACWNRAVDISLSDQTSEDFRSMGLKTLYDAQLNLVDKEGSFIDIDRKDSIVFIEGQYVAERSIQTLGSSIIAQPIEVAERQFSLFLQNRVQQEIQKSKSSLSLVNNALQEMGLFLYIPPNTKVEAPISLEFIYSGEEIYYVPRVQVLVGQGSEVTICAQNTHLKEGRGIVNSCIDIALEPNAKCSYFEEIRELENAIVLNHVKVTCKANSRFLAITANEGARLFNQSFEVELQGEGAEADVRGIWSLKGSARSNTKVLITHKAPHCRSNQLYKGVVRDQSRSLFEGKIYVYPQAQKTEAYQLNNNLILDPKAASFSRPNLEIFADDVKASHGSTIAELNEEELFYLQTRGLSRAEAKKRFVIGFLDAVVREIPVDAVLKRIRETYVI